MIEVRQLTKHYRVHKRQPGLAAAFKSLFRREYTTVKAVDGITFSIKPGERVGFLGPNGAGKTTTLKTLAGLLYPTTGEVRVDGHVPQRREREFLKKIMLVMGQKQQLLWDLPPAETFELNRAVYDVPRDVFTARMKELSELLELGDLVNKPTRQLSLGERMKCELAAALVHGPKVLFLDEPTIGLDVSMQVVMRDFIRRYNERTGATLILTSHYMDDVAALCPRVVVIDKGTLSFDGTLDDLVKKVRPEKRVTLRFSQPIAREQVAPLGTVVSCEGAQAVLQVDHDAVNAVVGKALATLPVVDLNVENPPLEEVMSELFSRSRAA
ncbi:MAG: ATP-binding cassette domain-containing protein [Myxococcaceae bacterium]|jgi:ABC-2 type transport system ATP-binding protein|nr:ATP-binding cassette domain-containing protein [Myxococcaceae bacterium]